MHSTHNAFIAGHKAKGYVKVLKTSYNSPRLGLAKIWKSRAQTVYKFRRILWRDHGKYEQKNKVLEISIIIINNCDIINAYNNYNYIINSQYNY
jgi:hypothetical protein